MQFTGYELYDLINRPGPLWLANADLHTAPLRGAPLRFADLSEADVRFADLRDADLRDANLARADLRDANVTGTRYNIQTKWPDGFDFEGLGAVFDEDDNL